MKTTRFAIIGGAGYTGTTTIKDLLDTCQSIDKIIVVDYDLKKLEYVKESFNSEYIETRKIDILSENAVNELNDVDILINCTPYRLNLKIMNLALAIKSHYLDMGGLFYMTQKQLTMNEKFASANLTAIAGMGMAPGTTNIMARYAADRMETVDEVHIKVAFYDQTVYEDKNAFPVSHAIGTTCQEFEYPAAVFTNGKMDFVEPASGGNEYEFPEPFNIRRPIYVLHSELATLPESLKSKGIKEVSFKLAFNERFEKGMRFLKAMNLTSSEPIEINGVKISPANFVEKVVMSRPRPISREPKKSEIKRVIVKGTKDNKNITWIMDYLSLKGVQWEKGKDKNVCSPISIAAQMVANEEISQRGVFPPESVVNPDRYLEELAKRKTPISISKHTD
ncbi:saccharopine dehydrogenase family protein [Dapis sp. BLCC M126]|uniref:saccharopine dehydrogenase family protein n=1 Tax=Dapis sp. BLCC M126 TaxID=3400189 RepID=UPI003CF6319B